MYHRGGPTILAVAAHAVTAARESTTKAGHFARFPHKCTGSHRQHRATTEPSSASLPESAHATPVVTYSAGHTTLNTHEGGCSGETPLASEKPPQAAEHMTLVTEMATPGVRNRTTRFASILSFCVGF